MDFLWQLNNLLCVILSFLRHFMRQLSKFCHSAFVARQFAKQLEISVILFLFHNILQIIFSILSFCLGSRHFATQLSKLLSLVFVSNQFTKQLTKFCLFVFISCHFTKQLSKLCLCFALFCNTVVKTLSFYLSSV